jgi:hypothetical protein
MKIDGCFQAVEKVPFFKFEIIRVVFRLKSWRSDRFKSIFLLRGETHHIKIKLPKTPRDFLDNLSFSGYCEYVAG